MELVSEGKKTLWLCALDLINSVFVGGYLD